MTAGNMIGNGSKRANVIAVLLAQVIIPAWLTTGAVLKLLDGSPGHLPTALIQWIGPTGIDLLYVLQFSIAVELIVAGVMVLLPALARPVGLLLLGVFFLPVLVGDVVLGAAVCGCFGAVEMPPWVTLLTDLCLLSGLLVFGRRAPGLIVTRKLPTARVVAAGVWSVACVAVAFFPTVRSGAEVPAAADPAGVSAGPALPAEGYHMPDYASWIGRPFRDLPIAKWVRGLPEDLNTGPQYVIFYRLDCEHCHALLDVYFSGSLTWPTTAIAVPERAGFPTENVLDFPCTGCRRAELPPGIDWFMKTPVMVRLLDGVVECAAEVDSVDPACLEQ